MMNLERAYEAPSRLEITVGENGQTYVNCMNFNPEDAGQAITAALVGVADECGLSIRDLARLVMRSVRKVVLARRVLGIASKAAPMPDCEPQKGQIIEVVAR